jgi:hypothetical protein
MTSKERNTVPYSNDVSVRSNEIVKVILSSKKEKKKGKNEKNEKKSKREEVGTPKNFEVEYSGNINSEASNLKKTSQNIKMEYSDKKDSGMKSIKAAHKKDCDFDKPVDNFRKEDTFLNRKRNLDNRHRNEPIDLAWSRSRSREERNFYGKNHKSFQHSHRDMDMRGHRPKKGWVCRECESVNFLSRYDCFKCRRRIPNNPVYTNLPEKNFQRLPSRSPLKGPINFMPPVPFHPKRGPVFNEEYRMKSSLHQSHSYNQTDKSTFKILPRNDPIESEFSYPEISSAILFLKKVKEAKTEDDKLKLIDSLL